MYAVQVQENGHYATVYHATDQADARRYVRAYLADSITRTRPLFDDGDRMSGESYRGERW